MAFSGTQLSLGGLIEHVALEIIRTWFPVRLAMEFELNFARRLPCVNEGDGLTMSAFRVDESVLFMKPESAVPF